MEHVSLSEIAAVQSGLVLSRKEAMRDDAEKYFYRRLNLRSINNDGSIEKESLEDYFALEPLDGQIVTAKDDVLMRLFSPLCPAIIKEDDAGLVVPSQVASIRIRDRNTFFPNFIYCYLAQPFVLREMAYRSGGQIVKGITISMLSNVAIPRLSLEKQAAIAAIYATHVKRKQLYFDLIEQYNLQTEISIYEAIGGEAR